MSLEVKPTHTPGPWVANDDGLVYSQAPRLGKHNVICAVGPDDARLIAAAPELLAVAQLAAVSEHRLAMLTHTQLSNLIRDIGQDARAAIAKAIGGGK